MKKMIYIFSLLFILAGTCQVVALAQGGTSVDLSLSSIPLPPDTIELRKEEELVINGVKARLRYFQTGTPPDEVRDFYRARLPLEGWRFDQEYDYLGVIAFTRGDDGYLYVGAKDLMQKGTTEFIVCRSESQVLICAGFGHIDLSKAKEAPGKDVEAIPRYPGSMRRFGMKTGSGGIYLYETAGGIEEVIDFYRREVAGAGWGKPYEFKAEQLRAELVEDFPELADAEGSALLFDSKEGVMSVNIFPNPHTGSTFISINYER